MLARVAALAALVLAVANAAPTTMAPTTNIIAPAPSSCAGKDRDYCTVDPSCNFDWASSTCKPISCLEYIDRPTCLADLSTVGPCTWNWDLNVCYNSADGIPCDRYTSDCPTDRCDYHAQENYCGIKGAGIPCYLYMISDCPSATCELVNDLCTPLGTSAPCSDFYQADVCDPTRCTYHPEVFLCWPTALPVPCNMYPATAVCPSPACTKYNVSSTETTCLPTGSPPACNLYTTQQNCPSGRCAWSPGASRCYNPQIGLDCADYVDVNSCPLTQCRVFNGVCEDKDKPVDCSALYYGDLQCNKMNMCRPNCTIEMCQPCPATGTCIDTPCGSVTPDPGAMCGEYLSQQTCDTTVCEWDDVTQVCQSQNQKEACSDFLDDADCMAKSYCAWSDETQTCIECTGSACGGITTTAPPDTGHACSTYTVTLCPTPRCISHNENGVNVCADPVCADIYDETACGNKAGCTFDPTLYVCYNTSEGIPCEYLNDMAMCQANTKCLWDATTYTCNGADSGKPCSYYTPSTCPERCKADVDLNICTTRTCMDFFNVQECLQNHCVFDNITLSCYNDTGRPCRNYTAFDQCPPDRCMWEAVGTNQPACIAVTCEQINVQLECLDRGCKFIPDMNLCFNDTGLACPQYPDITVCPEDRCKWVVLQAGANFSCADRVCADYLDETLCSSRNCTWDMASSSCYSDNGRNCSSFSSDTCPTDRCVYDYRVDACRSFSCSDIYDEAQCAVSSLGCVFNPQFGICLGANQPVPCDLYSFSASCPTDRCQYATDCQVCYPAGTQLPCEDMYDIQPCQARSYCAWDYNQFRCYTSTTTVTTTVAA